MDCFAALAMTDGLQLDCHALENCEVDVRAERSLTLRHKTHPSCPDLIRASINLRQKVFSKKMDHRVKPGDDGLSCYDGQCESAQPQTASFSMATLSKPTFAPAATISCQVVGSTGTPSARRCFFHSRSGSPAIFTWPTPAAGGEAVCQATKLSISRARFSPVPILSGSMRMENMPLSTLRLPSGLPVQVLSLKVLSLKVLPPESAPPSSSQISARPEPLCSPKGRIAPEGSITVKRGSVEGLP